MYWDELPGSGFRVLTWNVLISETARSIRLPQLLREIQQANADVVALQEVGSWFLDILLSCDWVWQQYHHPQLRDWLPFNDVRDDLGGLFILSKIPFTSVRYSTLPTTQNRGMLVMEFEGRHRSLAIGTVWLDSYPNAGSMRQAQLDRCFSLLKQSSDNAVLVGDFNFGDNGLVENATAEGMLCTPSQQCLDQHAEEFVDTFLACKGEDEHGFTWNVDVNPMARNGTFSGNVAINQRLDRVLLRSMPSGCGPGKRLRCSAVALVGTQARYGVHPSDHFGLKADFVVGEN